jgi:hypothetical protein
MLEDWTGERYAGRPIKSWNDYVRDDLDAIGPKYDWWRKVQGQRLLEYVY